MSEPLDSLEQRKLTVLEREIALKEREFEEGKSRAMSLGWHSPLVVAVGVAALGAFGNIFINFHNAFEEQKQISLSAENARILEMIKIGDPLQVEKNLRFLIEAGLVGDEAIVTNILNYYENVDTGEGPGSTNVPLPTSSDFSLVKPVDGKVIRSFQRDVNNGIDFAAEPGSPIRAAADGTVAAITTDVDGIVIVVLRHSGNLMTVYYNIGEVLVKKAESLEQGQQIGSIRPEESFMHFELRHQFDVVDPIPYLE